MANIMMIGQLNVRPLTPEVNYILGVKETWLSDQIPDELLKIDEYNFLRIDRGTRGGGVGVYLCLSTSKDTNLTESIGRLYSCLEEIKPTCDEIIILGDLNVNLLQHSNSAISNTDLVDSEVVHIDMHSINDTS
nr:unnamed protein product [Callosobruchus analis]